jgi:hypothetical protein
LPQAPQKCTARIVPHDQQVEVASPGMIRLDLDSELAIKNTHHERSTLFRPLACPGRTGGAVVFGSELA